MVVSVAICSKGRSTELRCLVKYISQSDMQVDEIVIVEDISSAEQGLDMAPIPGVKYYSVDMEVGFGRMRQMAVEQAIGEIVIFIDDDCLPCVGWLDSLLKPFENKSVSAVGGGFLPQDGNAVAYATSFLGLPGGGFQRLCRLQGKQEETRDLSNGSLAMVRQSVLDVGGYDVDLREGGEDSDLIARLPGTTLFEPNALVAHRNREDWRGIWRWFFRRGMAVAQYHSSQSHRGWSLRKSGMFKAGIISLFLLLLPAWITFVLCVSYYGLNVFRTYKGNSPAIQSSEVAEGARLKALNSGALFVAPILRLWMDVAFDFGFWYKRKSQKEGL